MKPEHAKLILSGWGRNEYFAAAAAALDAMKGFADVYGVSRAKLNIALTDMAPKYAEIYILGVGINKNIPETVTALRALRNQNRKVYWLSKMALEDEAEKALQAEFGKSCGFEKMLVRESDANLVRVVANWFGDEEVCAKYESFSGILSKKEEKSDKNVVAVYQRLFGAAGYYHREIHDDLVYGKVVRKLWESQKLAAVAADVSLMKKLKLYDMYGDDEIVGDSQLTKDLIARIAKVAPSDSANVLILGETGTGKELIAKQIHRRSPRKDGPLVVDNCGSMTGDLVNDKLFGHEAGSFTSGDKLYRGLIEQANGGTLFLDEIGELPLEAQAKLLRVLDTHKLTRLGGDYANQIDVDFRLVAATNRNLVKQVAAGKFREDLLQRLATVIMYTTPLRERSEDILKIAKYRWPKITRRPEAKLSKEQGEALLSYDWPGNVRELNNILERANAQGEKDFSVLIAEQRKLMSDLSAARKAESAEGAVPPRQISDSIQDVPQSPFASLPENQDELLRLHAKHLYDKYGKYNVAAVKAGISVNTFKNQLKI